MKPCLLAACALLLTACTPGETGRPTNLLVVTLDSVRPERFGASGAVLGVAPSRWRISPRSRCASRTASRARRERCPRPRRFSPAAIRASWGIRAPNRRLPDDVPTLAEILKRAGFDTAGFVAPFSLRPAVRHRPWIPSLRSAGVGALRRLRSDRACAHLAAGAQPSRQALVSVGAPQRGHTVPYLALETPFIPLNFFYKAQVPVPGRDERRLPLSKSNSGRGGLPDYQRVNLPPTFSNYRPLYDARVRVGGLVHERAAPRTEDHRSVSGYRRPRRRHTRRSARGTRRRV